MAVEHSESTHPRSLPNGAAPDQGATGGTHERPPVMDRAEELADQLGERISHYAFLVGHKLMQFAARAREEAEDIWAEAQSLRRGEEPPPS